MTLLNKYKKELLVLFGLVIVYFITRIVLLGNLPIFTDEAIYVRWTQIAAQDASWRFISLTDGKQPMLVWIGMILVKLIEDPLIAVRLVSVVAGFFSLLGLIFVSYELFKNKTISFLTGVLYIFYPFAVVYDRMALYDSLVAAFAIWAFYVSIILVRKIRLDVAYTLGFVIGGGMLTKSNAEFSIFSLPFMLLLFNFKQSKWKNKLIMYIGFAIFSAVIAEGMYNLLRLSPYFHIISEKNTIFVYPFSEWIKHPFTFFLGNLRGLTTWLVTYLNLYVVVILISFIDKKFIKEKVLLFLYFLAPFIADALFGKVIFPRHIFFTSLYLLPLAGYGLNLIINYASAFLKKRNLNVYPAVLILITLFFILYSANVSFNFIFNPQNAAIASSDKNQYITQWPSGGGVKESIEYFNKVSVNQKIFVGTQGTFGLMPASLEIYLNKNPNIQTKGFWPIGDQIPSEAVTISKEMPTYFVFYQPCPSCAFIGEAPKTWPLKLIQRIKKSEGVYYSIYQVVQ